MKNEVKYYLGDYVKRIIQFFQLKMPGGYDKAIHACVILLMLFGSIMVVSTSVGQSVITVGGEQVIQSDVVIRTIIKQLLFVILSYFMMVKLAVNFFKWKRKKNFNQLFTMVGVFVVILLVATLAFPAVNGAKAWIQLPLGLGTIQPSEFAKVYLVILMGLTVNHFGAAKVDLITYMKRPMLFFIAFLAIIIIQPDMGTAIILFLLFFTCFIIPSHGNLAPAQKLVKIGLFLVIILMILVMTDFGMKILTSILGDGYKVKRFINAANPFEDIYDTGYNLVYSLYAIANGGMSGLGIGGSELKYGYLPEADTDFILSVTIEELGLFGFLIIVLGYALILYRLFYYAKKTKSDGYRLILVGCALYLSLHFILNVGGVSALLPLTGVPLLFISSGGSSLLAISMMLGVCQSIIAMTKNQAKRTIEKRSPF